MPLLPEARAPEGLRIYAIGDVHGCLDKLEALHEWIEIDLAAERPDDWRVVHVGDYVDRGPDSFGVVDYMMRKTARDPRYVCLMGNHDQMFAETVAGSSRHVLVWMEHGGAETLASYGLTRDEFDRALLEQRGFDDIPAEHIEFLLGLGHYVHYGDYFFAHAGIDPDQPLDDQDPRDLMWIRGPFLRDERDHGAVVVHGHTPTRDLDIKLNRLGIDTAAVFGGSLTCVVFEGAEKGRLMPDGVAPLA